MGRTQATSSRQNAELYDQMAAAPVMPVRDYNAKPEHNELGSSAGEDYDYLVHPHHPPTHATARTWRLRPTSTCLYLMQYRRFEDASTHDEIMAAHEHLMAAHGAEQPRVVEPVQLPSAQGSRPVASQLDAGQLPAPETPPPARPRPVSASRLALQLYAGMAGTPASANVQRAAARAAAAATEIEIQDRALRFAGRT